jgi:hypothetical protein
MRREASLRWSIPQEATGEVLLDFDVTERYDPSLPHRLSISRQYGTASVALKRVALVTSGGVTLQEFGDPATIGSTTLSHDFSPATVPAGERVFLRLTLQGQGNHAVANGPLDFSSVFEVSRQDYIGRFQYSSGGSSYYRELREDGSLRLYVNGVNYGGWAGYTWRFVNGEAHLFNAAGSLFERHRLADAGTLVFQVEPQYGPGIRIPSTSYYRTWAIDRGLAAIADDPDGDADRDGLSNIDEFFFGTDPARGSSALELATTESGALRLRWKQRTNGLLEAIAYGMEESRNLTVWSPASLSQTLTPSAAQGYLDVVVEVAPVEPASFFRATASSR